MTLPQKEDSYEEKVAGLRQVLSGYAASDMVLAFSGGVDSSLLLGMCCQAARETEHKVYAITVETRLHPSGDLPIAARVCREMGAEHVVLHADELLEAGISENPVDRCYRCKLCIFRKIKEFAEEREIPYVIEGTNEDDLHVYRPGIRALQELSIESPLAACAMTKAEVRRLAAEYGISVADRPSTPCMATRFPYGARLDYEAMHQVELGENWLRDQGFYNVRLRLHGDILRIELDEQELDKVMLMRREVIEQMKSYGFLYITLDLEGFRSGSMDVKIK